MNLRDDLAQALKKGAGLEMRRILTDAYASGIRREDALSVLDELYDIADGEGDEAAEDALNDFRDILKWHCHPANYIWRRE